MTQIPAFPYFIPLDLSHRETVDSFNSIFPFQNSDHNFISLWGYMHSACSLSMLDDILIFQMVDYDDGHPYISLSGANIKVQHLDKVFAYIEDKGYPHYIRSIRIESLEKCKPEILQRYKVTDDIDFYDYIFDASLISSMQGSEFARRRKELSYFQRHNSDIVFRSDSLDSHEHLEEIYNLFVLWEAQNDHKVSTQESAAFRRILEHRNDFHLHVPTILVSGKVVAFLIYEHYSPQHVMAHYTKSDKECKMVNTVLVHEMCKDMHTKGIKYMNYQQDLGIDGLRFLKQSWNPVSFVQKYKIIPK